MKIWHRLLPSAVFFFGTVLVAGSVVSSCKTRNDSEIKASPQDRAYLGEPYEYSPSTVPEAALKARLNSNMGARREFAWSVVAQLVEPTKVGTDAQNFTVPRWYTWYDPALEFSAIAAPFKRLSSSGRRNSPEIAKNALDLYNKNERPFSLPRRPVQFDAEMQRLRGRLPNMTPGIAGVGGDVGVASEGVKGFTMFSPAFMRHLLASAFQVVDCPNQEPRFNTAPEDGNFAPCLQAEFPRDAVAVKAIWRPWRERMVLPTYDFSPGNVPRLFNRPYQFAPAPHGDNTPVTLDRIFNVNVDDGTGGGRPLTYVLAGLQIATKDIRERVWVTLWWSPRPGEDFGADRPASLNGTPWANYKMCVTTGFAEGDRDPGQSFASSHPSLAATLRAFARADAAPGEQWCANPFIETSPGHAPTNCIGCHQRAGPEVAGEPEGNEETLKICANDKSPRILQPRRQLFPDDFMFSINRVFRPGLETAFK